MAMPIDIREVRDRLNSAHLRCDIKGVRRIISELGRCDEDDGADRFWRRYYLARAHAVIADSFFKGKTTEMAFNHARRAADALSALERRNDPVVDAEVYALLGGVLGHVAAGAPDPVSKAATGLRADRALAQALASAPDNPRALLMFGRSLLLKPRVFGGNKKAALATLEKARERALEPVQDDALPLPDWGYEEICFWLAHGLLHFNRFAEARAAIRACEEVRPDFYLVEPMLRRIAEKETGRRAGTGSAGR